MISKRVLPEDISEESSDDGIQERFPSQEEKYPTIDHGSRDLTELCWKHAKEPEHEYGAHRDAEILCPHHSKDKCYPRKVEEFAQSFTDKR